MDWRIEDTGRVMFPSTLGPEQLAMLTEVVNAYCRENNIESGSDAHERASIMALHLFKSGFKTRERLADALRLRPNRQ